MLQEQTTGTSTDLSNASKRAQSFQLSSPTYISSVHLLLQGSSEMTGSVVIYEDSDGAPDETKILSNSALQVLTNALDWNRFSLGAVKLEAGKTYWIVFSGDGKNFTLGGSDSNAYPNGLAKQRNDTAWANSQFQDFDFKSSGCESL